MEEPGGGAVRRGLPLVPFYPSSAAATPSPRSAQRAPGPSTHLPAGPGRAEGGARALEAPRRHCACPGEGRGGTGSGGRARPYHPPGSVRLASGQWPRRARARVWEPAGSQFARQACAEPRGGGAEHSRGHRWRCGSGPPVPPPASGLGIPPTSFRATWGGKCYPRGQKMLGARAREWQCGRACLLCRVRSRAGGQLAPSSHCTVGPRTSSSAFRVPVSGRPLVPIAYRPPSGSIGSRDALLGGSNGTFRRTALWSLAAGITVGRLFFSTRRGKRLRDSGCPRLIGTEKCPKPASPALDNKERRSPRRRRRRRGRGAAGRRPGRAAASSVGVALALRSLSPGLRPPPAWRAPIASPSDSVSSIVVSAPAGDVAPPSSPSGAVWLQRLSQEAGRRGGKSAE